MPAPVVYKVQRPTDPVLALSSVRRTLDALDALGLDDALPEVRAKLAHAERLAGAWRDAPARLEEVRSRVVAALIADEVTVIDALAEVAAAEAAAHPPGGGDETLQRATRGAAQATWAALKAHGDRLVTDLLRPLVDHAVAVIAKTAPTLPGAVTSDRTALAAGPKAREAWARIVDAHTTWVTVHHLADALRREGVLSLPAGVTVTAAPGRPVGDLLPLGVFRFRRLDLATVTGPDRHPALTLADDVAAGAEPGLYIGPDIDLNALAQEMAAT